MLNQEINLHIQQILSGEIEKETIAEWYQRFIANEPQVLANISKQQELIAKVHEIYNKRFDMEARLHEQYVEMSKEVQVEGLFEEGQPLFHTMLQTEEQWINETAPAQEALTKMKASKYNSEIADLEQNLENVIYKGFIAKLELEENVIDTRKRLFSDQYNQRLEELAREGILLYDVDYPIYPLLDESVTIEDILDSFVVNNYFAVKDMFGKMLEDDDSSLPINLQRKRVDLKCAIIALENGELRSSARNLFALLEGEHKDCASIWDNYFKLLAGVRKGKERSEEITKIVQLMNDDYYRKVWDIVDSLYKRITSNSKDALINRNAITHGDYKSDQMDITAYDVIKLFTLYCNLRMINSRLTEHSDMLKNILLYGTTSIAQDLKKNKQ